MLTHTCLPAMSVPAGYSYGSNPPGITAVLCGNHSLGLSHKSLTVDHKTENGDPGKMCYEMAISNRY